MIFQTRKRLMIATTISLFGVILPTSGQASNAEAGYVRSIAAGPNGVVFFVTDGARSARPTCSTLQRWAIDVSSPGGQAMMSQLLVAYTSGIKIKVTGKETCDVWPDTESVRWVVMDQ